ncbi:MAG: ankyrin repeat domain-containing protein [Melioribacteraceae bacterium]|nr:ankyrin repeat domain-containing protein [Melioribacteraceae bacterium]
MKRTIMFLSLILLVAMIGCGNQNESSDVANEQNRDVIKPTMDLFAAAATGNVDEINLHINAGSDLNVKEPGRGSSPLLTAIVFDKYNAVEALIKGGANINQQNNEGSTPLLTAAVFCRFEAVKLLLDNGADKTIKNAAGKTALDAVSAPFDKVKPVYDNLAKGMAPMGVRFDYKYLEETRPKIAELLK